MNTKLTYLGGATFIIEVGPFRFLTDPGFDPKGKRRLLHLRRHRLDRRHPGDRQPVQGRRRDPPHGRRYGPGRGWKASDDEW